MEREIPYNLRNFLKNAVKDVEDGYEYASELNRILNSHDCQKSLSAREIETLRDFANAIRKSVGEINHYSEEKIKEIERDYFGARGILGYLGISESSPAKPEWPF